MNRIRRYTACAAASTLLSLGALGLASPAQAQTGVPTSNVVVADVRADDTSGTADDTTGTDCSSNNNECKGGNVLGGILGGLLHVVGGLLGGVSGGQ